MQLDVSAAERAIAEHIAVPLGYAGESGMIQMADGIIAIAIVIMAGAIRKISVEHGLDPRDFVLFSYGGGGPLHAARWPMNCRFPPLLFHRSRETSRRSACFWPTRASIRRRLSSEFSTTKRCRRWPRSIGRWKAKRRPRWRRNSAPAMCSSSIMLKCGIAAKGTTSKSRFPDSKTRANSRGLRARLQAALRPRRRQGAGGISSAAFVRVRAPEAAGRCALAARGGKIRSRRNAPSLYRQRRRLGRRADLSSRWVGAGFQRRWSGGDRRIRFDDGGMAGGSIRNRRAA